MLVLVKLFLFQLLFLMLVWVHPDQPGVGYQIYSSVDLVVWHVDGGTTNKFWPIQKDSPHKFYWVTATNSSGEATRPANVQ